MLITATNIRDPDGAYAMLLTAHEGLTDEESFALNARLVLILANHVGELRVLAEAIKLARETKQPPK
jgi:hypothetical protein